MKVITDGTDRFLICPQCQEEIAIDWEDTEDGDKFYCDCGQYLTIKVVLDEVD